MHLLVILINFATSSLVIYNQNSSSPKVLTTSISTFGSPSLFQKVGKIKFQSPINCDFSEDLENFFVLISNWSDCEAEAVALACQSRRAKLVLLEQQSLLVILGTSRSESEKVEIPVIGIQSSDVSDLLGLKNSTIWASYAYDMTASSAVYFHFIFSGNYTLDNNYFSQLKIFDEKTRSSKDILSMQISSLKLEDPLITDIDKDCLRSWFYENICMQSEGEVFGKQKLLNTLAIYNYIFMNPTMFIDTITNFYRICEFDYSSSCIKRILGVDEIEPNFPYQSVVWSNKYAPYMTINEKLFFWPEFLVQAALLSDWDDEVDFAYCADGCSNRLLNDSICSPYCDNSECGFDNLTCLISSGCFEFFFGDGYCDISCESDPDCLMCAEGCSFLDMEDGKCPFECSGDCFKNCSPDWCSPGCSYNDLEVGLCSTDCSLSCEPYCQLSCSPGCSFESMRNNLCPSDCTVACFKNCNEELFCSPGCLFSDLSKGKCSSSCNEECMEKCVENLDECSSGCFYSDFEKGNCSSDCSDDCLKECENYLCSDGCSYSSMSSGKCSVNCTSDCFSNYCNLKLYCSPGCSYSDFSSGFASQDCSEECRSWFEDGCFEICGTLETCDSICEKQGCCSSDEKSDDSNSKLKIIYLAIIPVVVVIVLFAICIGICVYVRKRRLTILRNIQLNDESRIVSEKQLQDDSNLKFFSPNLFPVKFGPNLNYIGEGVCTIDISGFRLGDPVIITPCFHIFHPGCIFEWLNTNNRERRCPNCNFGLENIKIHLK